MAAHVACIIHGNDSGRVIATLTPGTRTAENGAKRERTVFPVFHPIIFKENTTEQPAGITTKLIQNNSF